MTFLSVFNRCMIKTSLILFVAHLLHNNLNKHFVTSDMKQSLSFIIVIIVYLFYLNYIDCFIPHLSSRGKIKILINKWK